MDGGSPDACRLPPLTVGLYTPFRTHAVFWLHGRPFATARFVPGISATPRLRVDRLNVLGFARRNSCISRERHPGRQELGVETHGASSSFRGPGRGGSVKVLLGRTRRRSGKGKGFRRANHGQDEEQEVKEAHAPRIPLRLLPPILGGRRHGSIVDSWHGPDFRRRDAHGSDFHLPLLSGPTAGYMPRSGL